MQKPIAPKRRRKVMLMLHAIEKITEKIFCLFLSLFKFILILHYTDLGGFGVFVVNTAKGVTDLGKPCISYRSIKNPTYYQIKKSFEGWQ